MKFREDYGEKLTQDSFLIREQFDIRDPFAISKCKEVKAITISRNLINLAERSGIRQKDVLEEGKHVPRLEKTFLLHMVFASSLQVN
jgi:hypothetical protein